MKRILAVLLAVMLLMAVVPATSLAAEAANSSTYKVYRVSTYGSNLMLRSGPGTGYRVIASLCNGKPLKYLYRTGNWYKVRTFNGLCGYV